MSDRMEDLMRRTLVSRAAEAGDPSFATDDLVRRGESARRRRQVGAVGATALAAVVVILVGALLGRSATAPEPVRPITGHRAPVDLTVVAGTHLRTKDREITVPVNLTTTKALVTEVRGGWLSLPRAAGTGTLSFIDPSGTMTPLADGVDGYIVDSTGTRVAFTSRGGVSVGRLEGGRITDLHPTPSADGGRPVTFAGDHLVLTADGSCCGGDNQQYVAPKFTTWKYDGGGFTPRWTTKVAAVYGPVSDGTLLLGMVRRTSDIDDERGCLALLRPDDLAVAVQRCDLGLSWGSGYGTLSPSGQYFFDLTGETATLFTLDAGLSDVRRMDVPVPDTTPLWDDDTALAEVNRAFVLLRAGQAPETIPRFTDLSRLALRPFTAG